MASQPPTFQTRLAEIVTRAGPRTASVTPRPLIVSFAATNPVVIRALEEDLIVLHHILAKSVSSADAPGELQTMGLALRGLPDHSTDHRVMYLEDHGAVFVLNASFPLMGAARPRREPPREHNSEWERAREELFGDPGTTGGLPGGISTVPEYDPERVEQLTNALLQALKNGSRIRHLRSEDWVSVAVVGPAVSQPATARGVVERRVAQLGRESTTLQVPLTPPAVPPISTPLPVYSTPAIGYPAVSSQGRSQLLLRVKKADMDAFAKGEIDLESFREKAVMAYGIMPGEQPPTTHALATTKAPARIGAARRQLLAKDTALLEDTSWLISEENLRKVFEELSPKELALLDGKAVEDGSEKRADRLWQIFSAALSVRRVGNTALLELHFSTISVSPRTASELVSKVAQIYARLWPELFALPDPVDQPSRFL